MQKTLGLVAVLAVIGFVGWMAFGPNSQGKPQVAATSGTGAALAVVSVPDLQGNAILGKQVFDAKCASCHGANAAGQDGVAPPLVHKYYEPSHHGDGAFLLAVQTGVRQHHWKFGDMPPVEGLTTGDVAMIVAYIRTLQRENGIF